MCFSSGSESRDFIRRADLLRKQKGRNMRKTFDHRILYGQMDDGGQSCQNLSEADGQRCKR